jgi:hypothetical protein
MVEKKPLENRSTNMTQVKQAQEWSVYIGVQTISQTPLVEKKYFDFYA